MQLWATPPVLPASGDSTADETTKCSPAGRTGRCEFVPSLSNQDIWRNCLFALLSEMSGLALSQGSLLNVFQGKRSYQPVWQVMKWSCVMFIRSPGIYKRQLFDWILRWFTPTCPLDKINRPTMPQAVSSLWVIWLHFFDFTVPFRWVMVNTWRTMWPCILTAVWLSTRTHGKGRIIGGVLRTSSHLIDFPQ